MKKRWFSLAMVVLAWGVALLALVSVSVDTGLGLLGSVRAAPMAGEPAITEVDPSSASNDLDTPIVISGTDFITGAEAFLGATPLENVEWVNSTRLAADVPWGLPPGVYTLTVANPDDLEASLPEAFTVTQGLGVWTTGGPYGGMVERLVLDPLTPTTLYAPIFQVGLLASYDGADHWEPILPGGYIYAAVDTQNPDVLYAAGGGGLLRSLDGGVTWESITILDPSIGCFIHRPVTHPTSEGVLYVATAASPPATPIPGEGGIYRSLDYGDHWLTMTTGLTDTHVVALAFDPQDPETMAAGTDAGNLFVSENAGETWTWRADTGAHINRFYYNPFQDHEAWVIPHRGWPYEPPYLYRSVDPDLRVWTPITVTGETGFSGLVFALAFAPDTVFVAADGVYTSTDSGATWVKMEGLQHQGAAELVIDPQHPEVMYAGSGPGVFKTTDGGATWTEANEGLAGVVPIALAVSPVDPDTIYAKTHELGLLKSYNGGRAWASNEVWVGGRPWPALLALDAYTPTRLYLAERCDGVPCIRIGRDEEAWSETAATLPITPDDWCGEASAVASHPAIRGRILAGALLYRCDDTSDKWTKPAKLYISHDFGVHWENTGPTQTISRVVEFAFDSGDPDLVYAATAGTGLWKSTDGGSSWEACPFAGTPILDSVAVHPYVSGLVYAVDIHDVEGTRLYRSEDAGATWEEMPYVPELPGITCGYRLLFVPTQPATLYTGCGGDIFGLCRSADGGYTWELLEGSPRVIVLAEGSDGERVVIYVGTGGGVVTQQTIAAGTLEVIPGRGSVMSAGVHRLAFRLPAYWLYLPLAARGY